MLGCSDVLLGTRPDEDITGSNTTILTSFDSKVNQFHIIILFNTFDELLLQHDVCSLSFSVIRT
jgi:hypothetical protein